MCEGSAKMEIDPKLNDKEVSWWWILGRIVRDMICFCISSLIVIIVIFLIRITKFILLMIIIIIIV